MGEDGLANQKRLFLLSPPLHLFLPHPLTLRPPLVDHLLVHSEYLIYDDTELHSLFTAHAL